MTTPEQRIGQQIDSALRFMLPDSRYGILASLNASFVGGYSELLVAAALTRRKGELSSSTWQRADSARTGQLRESTGFEDVRKRAAFDGRRYDEVDLWIAQDDLMAGAWAGSARMSAGVQELIADLKRGRQRRILTVQVKARAEYQDNAGYDAIPYKYFVEPNFSGTRRELLSLGADPWKPSSVDVFACVLWRAAEGQAARPDIRVLSRSDVHNAVLATEQWWADNHERCTCDKPLNWAARKVDFDTIFRGRLGTRLTSIVKNLKPLELS